VRTSGEERDGAGSMGIGAGRLVELPAPRTASEVALDELELVYAFIYARVGNRPDAEDLAQQVAMKAIPRLREGAAPEAIRAYLFATARSVLAGFWAVRFGLPEEELKEDLWQERSAPVQSGQAMERVGRILDRLPANYRRLLELRFLRGYSLREVAAEMTSTVGAVKVMQLRALRAAAKVVEDA
jgi:RNA polymerase sigma factor (sigma-70 family)